MLQLVHTSLEIYTFPEIDLRNGDFLTVQKTSANEQVYAAWRGICGEPFRYEPFQTVHMQMAALVWLIPFTSSKSRRRAVNFLQAIHTSFLQ